MDKYEIGDSLEKLGAIGSMLLFFDYDHVDGPMKQDLIGVARIIRDEVDEIRRQIEDDTEAEHDKG